MKARLLLQAWKGSRVSRQRLGGDSGLGYGEGDRWQCGDRTGPSCHSLHPFGQPRSSLLPYCFSHSACCRVLLPCHRGESPLHGTWWSHVPQSNHWWVSGPKQDPKGPGPQVNVQTRQQSCVGWGLSHLPAASTCPRCCLLIEWMNVYVNVREWAVCWQEYRSFGVSWSHSSPDFPLVLTPLGVSSQPSVLGCG